MASRSLSTETCVAVSPWTAAAGEPAALGREVDDCLDDAVERGLGTGRGQP